VYFILKGVNFVKRKLEEEKSENCERKFLLSVRLACVRGAESLLTKKKKKSSGAMSKQLRTVEVGGKEPIRPGEQWQDTPRYKNGRRNNAAAVLRVE
jgi:hypothetical protein